MELKRTKISKLLLIILIITFTLFITACNETIPNEGYVKLDISENYKEYIKSDIPSFTLNFDGTLNTIKNVNKSYYTVFSGNDDIILSDALTQLFEEYKDKMYVEVTDTKKSRTREFSHLENGPKFVDRVIDLARIIIAHHFAKFVYLLNSCKMTQKTQKIHLCYIKTCCCFHIQ